MNEPRKHRIVNAIGKPLQQGGPSPDQGMAPSSLVREIMQSIMPGPSGPQLNSETIMGAPPWAISLMNMFQNGLAEISALKLVLMRRGLVTEAEFTEAAFTISRQYEQQFIQQVQQLDQQVQKAAPAPADPRKAPQP